MIKNSRQHAEELNNKRSRKTLRKKVLSVLAAFTVFCTTYSLIIPVLTIETDQLTQVDYVLSSEDSSIEGSVDEIIQEILAEDESAEVAEEITEGEEAEEVAEEITEGEEAEEVAEEVTEGEEPAEVAEEITEGEEPVEVAEEVTEGEEPVEVAEEVTEGEDVAEELVLAEAEIRATAEDGAEVVINGMLPENAEVTIIPVSFTDEELVAYFGEELAASMKGFVAYDISIWANGNEWQPTENVNVQVSQPAIEVEENDELNVVHFEEVEEETAITEVVASVTEEGSVEFAAESFSIYAFYTVDFYYGDLEFSIAGETSILLSELFAQLNITKDVADVTAVEFTDYDLVSVEAVEGDWLLTSLQAFTSEEHLTITFQNGKTMDILVLDAVPATTGTAVQQGVTKSKTGKQIGDDPRDYEVTLTVSGMNGGQQASKGTDVILLMDITSSLGPGILDLKSAAKDFIDAMIGAEDSTARVALITYTDYAHRVPSKDPNGRDMPAESVYMKTGTYTVGTSDSAYYYTNDSIQSAKDAIDGIKTKKVLGEVQPDTLGATNVQYGLRLVEQLLELEPSDRRPVVVLISDGAPNRGFKLSDNGSVTYTSADGSQHAGLNISQQSYSGSGGDDKKYYETYQNEDVYKYYKSIQPTGLTIDYLSEAGYGFLGNGKTVNWICTNVGSTKVYQPAQIGPMQMAYYESAILKQKTDLYVVGVDLDNTQCKNYIKRLATEENYAYNTDASGLVNTLSVISKRIYSANNAVVTDKMGDDVTLVYPNGTTPRVTTDISVYNAKNADVYVSSKVSWSYDTTNETITWSIGNIPFGESFTMKYRVRIDDGVYGDNIPLNQKTFVDYDIVNYDSSTGATKTEHKQDKYDDPVGKVPTYDFTVDKQLVSSATTDRFGFKLVVKDKDSNPVDVSGIVAGMNEKAANAKYTIQVDPKDTSKSTILFTIAATDDPILFKLPQNAKLTLTETSHDGFEVSMKAGSADVAGDEQSFDLTKDTAVLVTNTRATSALTVSKQVIGSQTTDRFGFKLVVTETDGTTPVDVSSAITSSAEIEHFEVQFDETNKNIIVFTLAAGEEVSFDIPQGAIATVTETSHDGFTVTMNQIAGDSTSCTIGSEDCSVTVINTAGYELPSTGGIGTTIFYVVGGILLVGAAVLLITKKRMDSEEGK